MTNVDNLRLTLTAIRDNQDQWSQREWRNCLAGWAVRVLDAPPLPVGENIEQRAAELLGLDENSIWSLFRFTHVPDLSLPPCPQCRPYDEDCLSRTRHPTFAELLARVTEVTGVDFSELVVPA